MREGDAALDIPVRFTVPKESEERGFPRLEGEGRATEEHGRLVLRGKVFRLTAWWLKVLAPIALLATGALYVALQGVDLEHVGLYLGLGLTLALVVADFVQQRAGRDYALEVPRPCAYRLEIVGARCVLLLHLDEFVVGGGRRPPAVQMELEAAAAPRIERLLTS